MTTLILFITLALVVSFLCSLMEAAILSVSHGYIETLRKQKRRSGEILRHLKERIDRPLAAILTLNTVANTIGAAGVGAQVQKLYTQAYGPHHAGTVLAVASGCLTLAILVFSEIIPKTLGAVYWKRLGPLVAYVVLGLVRILLPLVVVLELISRWVSGRRYHRKVSREEMIAVAELGNLEGSLLTQETRLIHNILRLHKIRARDVLTPRSVMLAFQQDKTIQEALNKHSPIRFSRIPIYGKDLDDITAVVHRYELVRANAEGKGHQKLSEAAKPIHAVPDTKFLASILDEFVRRQEQLFLVVDEYGGTAGIITLEDAIETLLGVEIVDEFDTVKDMRKLARQIGARRRGRENL
ncbi:MAG: HlyC/CorC family transporter [Sedimentisphaerales bacterium]|nr:HlyC/CorC family transporter [Sedimentisphaerales bacterium]